MGVDELAFWGLIVVLMAMPLVFIATLWRRKGVRTWWGFLVWAVLLWGSMASYGIVGMDYEDFDRPYPLWLVAGFTVAQIFMFGALGGMAWRLWRLWRSRKARGG